MPTTFEVFSDGLNQIVSDATDLAAVDHSASHRVAVQMHRLARTDLRFDELIGMLAIAVDRLACQRALMLPAPRGGDA